MVVVTIKKVKRIMLLKKQTKKRKTNQKEKGDLLFHGPSNLHFHLWLTYLWTDTVKVFYHVFRDCTKFCSHTTLTITQQNENILILYPRRRVDGDVIEKI